MKVLNFRGKPYQGACVDNIKNIMQVQKQLREILITEKKIGLTCAVILIAFRGYFHRYLKYSRMI